MPYCTNPDHDERFRGVFFCKGDCLACQLEETGRQLQEKEQELKREREKIQWLRQLVR